jgi:hypothetical protein
MLFLCVGCISLVAAAPVFAGARPALTQGQAGTISRNDAIAKWKPAVLSAPPCVGPFENVKGKTQWACYGFLEGGPQGGKHFQINLDPFGTIVFERLCASKCPGSNE